MFFEGKKKKNRIVIECTQTSQKKKEEPSWPWSKLPCRRGDPAQEVARAGGLLPLTAC